MRIHDSSPPASDHDDWTVVAREPAAAAAATEAPEAVASSKENSEDDDAESAMADAVIEDPRIAMVMDAFGDLRFLSIAPPRCQTPARLARAHASADSAPVKNSA